MARKRTSSAPLSFRGSPRGIEGLAPLLTAAPAAATLAVDLREADTSARIGPLVLQTEPAGAEAMWLRFDLPPTTPPGTYSGSVQLGTDRFPITVDVHPQQELAISPQALAASASAGDEATIEFILINEGNVPFEVGRTHAFNLLQREAIEEAIHAALRAETAKGESRLDRFADELANRHGGLVRISIADGAGELAPGEARSLRAVLRLPANLTPGSTYTSTWPLGNLNVSVDIQIEPAARRARGKQEVA
jgi:hypothetical protein